MYNEIKQNFIEKFFNKNFRYTTVSVKEAVIDKIRFIFPFDFTVSDNVKFITLHLGNNVDVTFKFHWTEKELSNGCILYCLTEIS